MIATHALLLATLTAVPAAAASAQQTPGVQELLPPSAAGRTVLPGHDHSGPDSDALLRIEQRLRCTCGCGLDPHTCQFQMQCGTSPVWSERIMAELERGREEEVILAGFVSDFGSRVLMAPPAEGFNWLGYLLPWAAVLAAGSAIGAYFWRRETPDPAPAGEGREVSPEEWARLREQIRRIEEEEFPEI